MDQKRPVDATGAAALIGVALLLAFNQVVIKVTGTGFGPVFQAGLRSAIALVFLLGWMWVFRKRIKMPRTALWGGLLSGSLFTVEFISLYSALDVTTVSRTSILFYSMPVWLTLAGHLLLPGEKLNPVRIAGLVLAMGGIIVAFAERDGGHVSLAGDIYSLIGAMCWAGIALVVRMTDLSKASAEMQLMCQLVVSAPLLLLTAPLFGELVRDVQPLHLAGLAFQAIGVVGLGFMAWFRLLAIYQASGVASFSFLSPVLAVLLGWALLGEQIGLQIWIALALVAAGIYLINRP
ncbi:DMT family transporter [Tropicibacter sp. R16_0]|uniref:DMT family transporter n=1 Tax=Tropicibacter sp. R16_0 TaxID=2821102 RepID=UPI001ADAE2EE|nr:DMT family transporter [Tropicibacter sp. R16_0]MBO9453203.1 DMT family transporter [Tropicibacter sp. R16_0]